MPDLATVANSATDLTTSTASTGLITKKNVAIAIVVTVVTLGLGYVLFTVISNYRAKKLAAAKPVVAPVVDAVAA